MANKDYADPSILSTEKGNGKSYNLFWKHQGFDEELALSATVSIQKKLTKKLIHEIILSIPPNWESFISDVDKATLEEYFNYKIIHLVDVVNSTITERRSIL